MPVDVGVPQAELERRLRERETVTVRCTRCDWHRTGKHDVVLPAQRKHVEGHVGPIKPGQRKKEALTMTHKDRARANSHALARGETVTYTRVRAG